MTFRRELALPNADDNRTPTCPLVIETITNPNLPILNEQEKTYLNSLSSIDLQKIVKTLENLSTDILTGGPQTQSTIKVRCDNRELIAPLTRIIEQLTNLLGESGAHYRACSEYLSALAISIRTIARNKQMQQAAAPDADETAIRAEAITALKDAKAKLGEIPAKSDHRAVVRYGLACVLLVMHVYEIPQIKQMLESGSSIPTHYTPVDVAVERLAALTGLNLFHLKIALGMVSVPGRTVQSCLSESSIAIHALLVN